MNNDNNGAPRTQAVGALTLFHCRELTRLAPRLAKVCRGDARFFERFPQRQHRIRLADPAELENAVLTNDVPAILSCFCHFVAVKRVVGDMRVRLLFVGLKGSETNVSEEIAREIYEAVRTPDSEQIERELAEMAK